MTGKTRSEPSTDPHRNGGFDWSEIIYMPSAFVVFAGLWLMAGGFIAAGEGAVHNIPAWNKMVVGAAMMAIAAIRVARPATTGSLSLLNVIFASWMIISPFVLGYHRAVGAAWNDVIVGSIVVLLAGVSWLATGKPRAAESGHGSAPPTS